MLGLMQDHPLLISDLIEFAARHHAKQEIVSRRIEGDLHRYTYRDAAIRSRRLAHALDALGLAQSARVATLAWNGYRHFELYYGVSGSGRVVHTLNPRLPPDQLVWIVNDAEDEVFCFDLSFLPLVKAVAAKCPTVKHWVALCEADALPADTGIPGLVSYEAWIAPHSGEYAWPRLDERAAAALCYTSGTTGNPKGVLYSHRSTLLHAITASLPDGQALTSLGAVLPVVPMFHVNGWGLPYGAPLAGMKIVFPGPALDGKSVYELIEAEQVTMAAGVPTVWLALLNHVQGNGLRFSSLRRTMIGGSAVPPSMIRAFRAMGVDVLHGWGHDRDFAARHRQQLQVHTRRSRRRGQDRGARQAGPSDLRRRYEGGRPRGARTPLGWSIGRRSSGARSVGGVQLFPTCTRNLAAGRLVPDRRCRHHR